MTWEVGDLAVFVGPEANAPPNPGAVKIDFKKGQIYSVERVGLNSPGTYVHLWFRGVAHIYGVRAINCRKILPDKHEQCEPEFVTLLKRIKRKVSA